MRNYTSKSSKYTAGQIVECYRLMKQGERMSEVSRQTGIPTHSCYEMTVRLDRYLKLGEEGWSRLSESVREALLLIKANNLTQSTPMERDEEESEPVEQQPDELFSEKSEDNFRKLDHAIEALKQIIADVVVEEADRRAKALVEKKDQEIEELNKKLEEYKGQYDRITANSQASSITGLIKKKLTIYRI